jgi:predicted glutamine amidotransferase
MDPPVQVDFSTVTTANDVVTILSTEPLTTDEHWHAIDPGSSMLWLNGELHGQHRS